MPWVRDFDEFLKFFCVFSILKFFDPLSFFYCNFSLNLFDLKFCIFEEIVNVKLSRICV